MTLFVVVGCWERGPWGRVWRCQSGGGSWEGILPDHWSCKEEEGSRGGKEEEGRGGSYCAPGWGKTGFQEGKVFTYPLRANYNYIRMYCDVEMLMFDV